VELLREWVETVASQANVNLKAASISLGAIGAPETELQVRNCFLLRRCGHTHTSEPWHT
jgi:hypothetical protein